jgi:hypothetical protein
MTAAGVIEGKTAAGTVHPTASLCARMRAFPTERVMADLEPTPYSDAKIRSIL